MNYTITQINTDKEEMTLITDKEEMALVPRGSSPGDSGEMRG